MSLKGEIPMKKLWCVLPAIALALTGLLFMACPDGNDDDDPPLSGNITITPAGPVTVGTQLTANYTGSEQVSYQWKRDTTNVGTGPTYMPYDAGSYTVTVSAAGFTGKTSAAVTVTEDVPGHTHQWGDWVITRQPTETVDGEETRICQLDPTHTQTQPIPATGGSSGVNTAELEDVLRNAHHEKDGVEEAANAADVLEGIFWVTADDMKSLNDAIDEAETAKDNAATQADVDAAQAKLEGALAVFMAAKKGGTAPSITLSGTITVKDNGQVVPYVIITAHDYNWTWREKTRISSSAEKSPWKIITKPLDTEIDIFFQVMGFHSDDDEVFFNLDVKDLMKKLKDEDIGDIEISLENIITLSGTINFDFDGTPIPSMLIRASGSNGNVFGDSPVAMQFAGNNTPWSIKIQALDEETDVLFHFVGSSSDDPWSESDRLFALWSQDLEVTVKDQDVDDIEINLITLSGTLNVTNNVDNIDVRIQTYYYYVENGSMWPGSIWINNADFRAPIENINWAIMVALHPTHKDYILLVRIQNSTGGWQTIVTKVLENITENTSDINFDIDLGEITVD